MTDFPNNNTFSCAHADGCLQTEGAEWAVVTSILGSTIYDNSVLFIIIYGCALLPVQYTGYDRKRPLLKTLLSSRATFFKVVFAASSLLALPLPVLFSQRSRVSLLLLPLSESFSQGQDIQSQQAIRDFEPNRSRLQFWFPTFYSLQSSYLPSKN